MHKSSVKVLQDDLLAFVPERSGMDAILLCLISESLRGEEEPWDLGIDIDKVVVGWGHLASKNFGYQVCCESQDDIHSTVKLSRSPSDCWDPLLLPQLHSNHPPNFWHYANHTPKLQSTPETSDALPSLSENSEWPLRTPIIFHSSSVFIILF